VQFYARDSELTESVSEYALGALREGGIAVLIATEEHHQAIERQLHAAGVDPARAASEGSLISFDASATLRMFMPDGKIDPGSFRQLIGAVAREAAARTNGSHRPIRAFGEMVALLWDEGNVPAAIELEELWNELQAAHDFALLCAYPRASVQGEQHADALTHVCQLHSAVL
jgi:MEDS: MEthanogen/methylotroph, DcmR Sensory domain